MEWLARLGPLEAPAMPVSNFSVYIRARQRHTVDGILNGGRRILNTGVVRSKVSHHISKDLVVVLVGRVQERRLSIVSNRLQPELAGMVRSRTSTACSFLVIMACQVSRRALRNQVPGTGSLVLNWKRNGSIFLSDFTHATGEKRGLTVCGEHSQEKGPIVRH